MLIKGKVDRDLLPGGVIGAEVGNLLNIIAQAEVAVFRTQAQTNIEASVLTAGSNAQLRRDFSLDVHILSEFLSIDG